MGRKLASATSHQTSVHVCAGGGTALCLGQLSRNFLGTWALSHLLPSRMSLPLAETRHKVSVAMPVMGTIPVLPAWKVRGQPLLFKTPVTFADLICWWCLFRAEATIRNKTTAQMTSPGTSGLGVWVPGRSQNMEPSPSGPTAVRPLRDLPLPPRPQVPCLLAPHPVFPHTPFVCRAHCVLLTSRFI